MEFLGYQWLVSTWGVLGVLVFTFSLSLVPFISPSNALEAMLISMNFPEMNRLFIGLCVAAGATAAKTVHFAASYGLGRIVDKHRDRRRSISKYGRLTLYIMNIVAAATPIPDEWVVIPMGLYGVNVGWFIITYFVGKLIIAVPSAYIGYAISPLVREAFGENTMIFSVAIGIAITAILILINVEKTAAKILEKLGISPEQKCGLSEDKS